MDWVKVAHEFGIPGLVVIYWFYKDWIFSMRQLVAQEKNTESQAKVSVVLETIQRDGVKCRHE